VEDVAELLVWHVALPEDIVILEELEQTDTVFFDLVLDLDHKSAVAFVVSCEVGPLLDISGFQFGCRSINGVFEAVGVLEELGVHDLILLSAVDALDESDLLLGEGVAEQGQRLLKLLS